MKALVLQNPRQLAITEMPKPTGEVVVRIAAAGICGSDMHAYLGNDERRPPPLILGHEASGETADGKKVIINPLVVCGECRYCRSGRDNLCLRRQILSMPPRPGTFAEYTSAPARNLIPLPPQLTMQQGALAEPLACGHHTAALALQHSHRQKALTNATVIGGGAIGVASALSLIARGIAKVQILEMTAARRKALSTINPATITAAAPPQNPQEDTKNAAMIIIDAVGSSGSRKMASNACGFDMRRLTLRAVNRRRKNIWRRS